MAGEAAEGLDDSVGGNRCDDGFVLFGLQRAGGVDQNSAGSQDLERLFEEGRLAPVQVVEIGGDEAPLDLGIAAKRAGAGTGSVEEDAVEGTGERERLSAVENYQICSEALELRDAVEVEIAGDDADAGFEGLGGLVSGGSTEVEDGLGADVLGAAGAGEFFGLAEGGAGDRNGGLGAEVALPASQQPFGTGELDFAGGPGDGVAIDLAEDGVDETGGGSFAGAFDEIDGIGDGGVGRNALEVAELVNGHAEGDADFGI